MYPENFGNQTDQIWPNYSIMSRYTSIKSTGIVLLRRILTYQVNLIMRYRATEMSSLEFGSRGSKTAQQWGSMDSV